MFKNFLKVKDVYATDLQKIHTILEKQNQVCVCGTDIQILKFISQSISKIYQSKKYKIIDIGEEEEILKDTKDLLCIMNIGESSGLLSSKLLYFYLEQSVLSSTKVLLYVNDCLSLDSLERRIKSRFKDNIYVVRNLTYEEYKEIYISSNKDRNKDKDSNKDTTFTITNKQYKISPSLDTLNLIRITNQYGIEEYNDRRMLDNLNTIHLSLMILFLRFKLEYNNVVREYKKFTSKVKELKNVKDEEIMFYYYDLLDFGIINEKGVFLYSEYEFKNYIKSKGTLYLRNLVKSIGIK